MDDLKDYLEMMRTAERSHATSADWAYRGLADFILSEGRAFEPAPLPEGTRRGQMKHCFANAFRLMADRNDLVYAEGYAIGVIPVLHAWCVDSDGRVVDPTWDDSLGCAYYGVTFDRSFVRRSVVRKGTYGLIDDMKGGYPLIRGCEGWRHEMAADVIPGPR